MSLDACKMPDNMRKSTKLIDMFKHQLTFLELRGMSLYDSPYVLTQLWEQIGECANLTSLRLDDSNAFYCASAMKKALRGKKIQKLRLGWNNIKADDFVEIVASLADQSLQ